MDWKKKLEEMKVFWTSKAVLVSLMIFVGLFVVMGTIALVSLLTGCQPTNYYTKNNAPTVYVRSISTFAGNRTLNFTVSNPTNLRIHRQIQCVSEDGQKLNSRTLIIAPRSDMSTSIIVPNFSSGTYECTLLKDTLPGVDR